MNRVRHLTKARTTTCWTDGFAEGSVGPRPLGNWNIFLAGSGPPRLAGHRPEGRPTRGDKRRPTTGGGRLDFGRRVPWHAHPIGPACTGLHLRSVLQRASGFFPTRPHGARPDCLATPHLRAVAFGLRLLPTCSAEDLHLQSRVHAWHTLAVLASPPATKALDPDPFPCLSLRHVVYAVLLHFGLETAIYYLSRVSQLSVRTPGRTVQAMWPETASLARFALPTRKIAT
jgi:hypothetical protein